MKREFVVGCLIRAECVGSVSAKVRVLVWKSSQEVREI